MFEADAGAGNQNVVMVTGDAVLTAAEVARRVGIIDAPQEATYELICRDDGTIKANEKFVLRPLDHNIGANSKTSFCQSVFASGSVALILASKTKPVLCWIK